MFPGSMPGISTGGGGISSSENLGATSVDNKVTASSGALSFGAKPAISTEMMLIGGALLALLILSKKKKGG